MIVIVKNDLKTVEIFSVKTLAAKYIGCNVKTVSRAIKTGRIIKGYLIAEREVERLKGKGRF
jgi:hypothetical protein